MNKFASCVFACLNGLLSACGEWDASLADYARLDGERDDTARVQRAVNDNAGKILYVPYGLYAVSSPVLVTNLCSILFHKGAVLRAVEKMPYVLKVNGFPALNTLPKSDLRRCNYNLFVTGGVIDGNGLASCMSLDGFRHFTLRDTTFLNGRVCGLRVNGDADGYEVIANNLYFKCLMSGLAGNTALWTTGGDSHFTDCIVVDYTIGFRLGKSGGNRLTRCHVWGGPLPEIRKGEGREMLKDSICFWIDGSVGNSLRDCFADTGKTGFLIDGSYTRLEGCWYFNNKYFGLDEITVIRHRSGQLVVADGRFVKSAKNMRMYEAESGLAKVFWRDNLFDGFAEEECQPGAVVCRRDARFQVDQPCASADEWDFLPPEGCVVSVAPGAFEGSETCVKKEFFVSADMMNHRFPEAGPGKEVVVRARATDSQTRKVELTFLEENRKVWGTELPLTPEWKEFRIPVSSLHYFRHWGGVPPLQKGDSFDVRKVASIRITFGKWLCPDTVDLPHGFEISSVRVTR